MNGLGKPQNSNNFDVVRCGILQIGPRNLAKFAAKVLNITQHLKLHLLAKMSIVKAK